MLSTGNLTALFHEMVRTAMAAQQVASSETTEFYLVQLLEGFARPARGNLLDPPLALHYLEAFHLPAAKSYEKLKRVADTALFITGVFVDSLERSLVGPEYYTALGRNAYARLSAQSSRAPLASLFEELAGRFPEFVRVLGEISAQELFRRQQDTLRLYKRWLHTRGPREADLLVRRGLPLPLGGQRAGIEHIRELERGPAEPARDRVDRPLQAGDRGLRAAEVVDDRDGAARAAHAPGFGHHAVRIRHHAHHVEGHHVVEAVVRELQVERIALLEHDVPPGIAGHLVLRPLEHVGREIDPGHLAVRGIGVEGEPGPDAQLEHARPGLDRERADDPGDARIEDAPEEQVVEVRELVVEPAFVRLRVRQSHGSPPCRRLPGP